MECVNTLTGMLLKETEGETEDESEEKVATLRLLEVIYRDYRFQKCIDEVLEASAKIGGAPMVGVQRKLLAIQHYSSVLHAVFKQKKSSSAWVAGVIDSLGSEISSLESEFALRKATAIVAQKILCADASACQMLADRWLTKRKRNEMGVAFMALAPHVSQEMMSLQALPADSVQESGAGSEECTEAHCSHECTLLGVVGSVGLELHYSCR